MANLQKISAISNSSTRPSNARNRLCQLIFTSKKSHISFTIEDIANELVTTWCSIDKNKLENNNKFFLFYFSNSFSFVLFDFTLGTKHCNNCSISNIHFSSIIPILSMNYIHCLLLNKAHPIQLVNIRSANFVRSSRWIERKKGYRISFRESKVWNSGLGISWNTYRTRGRWRIRIRCWWTWLWILDWCGMWVWCWLMSIIWTRFCFVSHRIFPIKKKVKWLFCHSYFVN